ncbi:hypothetical protein ASE97_01950 [Sphingomonas sp. Leaf42]|uniref:hypothetical protein n=1 Tax=unclassified Sphingomonas TaxID=196159 RepID=UPI0006F3F15A|nr:MULTISPECIES: hypothetical protein [unclassified Sphingomonas]KQN40572.1 hypothetical protein ASE97_01950 [Sphingomonas sp. Leaf42]
MRMKKGLLTAALGAMIAATMPATAQQMGKTVIRTSATKPYRFRHSRLAVPTVLDGIPRTSVEALGADELDVYARYERGNDMITVYVYRQVSGAVPVWFDRARHSIETRTDLFGTVTPAMAPAAFTPPGQTTPSGLIGAWSITKPPYRGTALALLPLGEWLVKVRYSSSTLDGAGVAARMPAVLAALDWPKNVATGPAAQPIADCATPLTFPTTAQPVRDEQALTSAAITGGLFASLLAKATPEPAATSVLWCRDPAPARVGGVYRANAATDAYLLAFTDSGRGASVAPDAMGVLLDDKAPPRWSVSLDDLGATTSYPPMTALPRPDQVIAALEGPALSRTSTWGKKRQVDVNSAMVGSGK